MNSSKLAFGPHISTVTCKWPHTCTYLKNKWRILLKTKLWLWVLILPWPYDISVVKYQEQEFSDVIRKFQCVSLKDRVSSNEDFCACLLSCSFLPRLRTYDGTLELWSSHLIYGALLTYKAQATGPETPSSWPSRILIFKTELGRLCCSQVGSIRPRNYYLELEMNVMYTLLFLPMRNTTIQL